MYIAKWQNIELARSTNTIEVEGNQYFPLADVQSAYLKKSDLHTSCHWKGLASYYDIVIDKQRNKNAAWYYPKPLEKATQIQNYVAFSRDITVEQIE